MKKEWIKLENEFGDIVIEKLSSISSMRKLTNVAKDDAGIRIWFNGEDDSEEGIDYITPFNDVCEYLELN